MDWQFAQLLDAVRIYMLCLVKSPSAQHVDWEYWKSSARTVSNTHSSTARQFRPEELIRQRVQNGTGSLAQIRQQHEELIVRFVTQIRARGYAYKTEQAYEQWVCRYIEGLKAQIQTVSALHEQDIESGNGEVLSRPNA